MNKKGQRSKRKPGRPSSEAPKILRRQTKALELLEQGRKYRQIAVELKISIGTAYADCQTELGRLDELKTRQGERTRDLICSRLDRALWGMRKAIKDGDPTAVSALVRVEHRRARLLGVDAAMQLKVEWTDSTVSMLAVALIEAVRNEERDEATRHRIFARFEAILEKTKLRTLMKQET